MSHTLVCGLDFGTSNTAVCLTDEADRSVKFIDNDKSILYFFDTNLLKYSVGKHALADYLGNHMRGRLVKSPKTLLRQTNFEHTWIFGKKFTASDLVSLIIKEYKKKVDEFTQTDVTDVVLGRPCVFSEDPAKDKTAENRLVEAAKKAGFKNITLQLEPIAAALSYERGLQSSETVLVADIGGGTSDFTVMELGPKNLQKTDRSSDIIAHGGVYVGGDLFDSEIMWHKITPHLGRGSTYKNYTKIVEMPSNIHWELRKWERSFLLKESKMRRDLDGFYFFSDNKPKIDNLRKLIDNELVYSMFQKIERSKIALSAEEATEIVFDEDEINIREPFNLEGFSEIILKQINAVDECVENMLQKASVMPSKIDSVFLTGGSSFAVPIIRLFESKFGKAKIRTGDQFNSIVRGLSLTRVGR